MKWKFSKWTIGFVFAALLPAQTAEELVAKNIQAKGGLDKMRAIHDLRMTGRLQAGPISAQIGLDTKAPDMLRQAITLQGMHMIQAYDGSSGWQISPFMGRKDPELVGEEELRSLQDEADFYGHLVDYQAKGNTVEYLGHDTVDGDDAYRLKVTLKNGDVFYYYLDPETFLEIRVERQLKLHGSVRESYTEMGSYKLVAGVYFPFSLVSGNPQFPGGGAKITIDKIEANVPMQDAEFKMPETSKPAPSKEK